MKLDVMRVLEKKSESTASLLKPDIGLQSSPRARAAIIRYAPPVRLPSKAIPDPWATH
jgi:hypothetical protein